MGVDLLVLDPNVVFRRGLVGVAKTSGLDCVEFWEPRDAFDFISRAFL